MTPPGTDAIRQLRLLLKRILRSHNFKCVSCEEVTGQIEEKSDG
jgi:hypothetical protein